jgi:hypothetical protein
VVYSKRQRRANSWHNATRGCNRPLKQSPGAHRRVIFFGVSATFCVCRRPAYAPKAAQPFCCNCHIVNSSRMARARAPLRRREGNCLQAWRWGIRFADSCGELITPDQCWQISPTKPRSDSPIRGMAVFYLKVRDWAGDGKRPKGDGVSPSPLACPQVASGVFVFWDSSKFRRGFRILSSLNAGG